MQHLSRDHKVLGMVIYGSNSSNSTLKDGSAGAENVTFATAIELNL